MSLITPFFTESSQFHPPLSPSAQFSLERVAEGLIFRASQSSPSRAHPDSCPHQFYEGLWEYDVAEVFFLEPDSGRYLEINLAPNGAWWACWHSGVRVREEKQPSFAKIEAQGGNGPEGWQASLLLPLSLFSAPSASGTTPLSFSIHQLRASTVW